MTVQTDFYDRVKELAKSHNTTVRAVIENCQINYDSYNSCKRYKNLPRADEAVKIAEYLDTSVEYLVTGKNPSQAQELPADLLDVLKKYISLNP